MADNAYAAPIKQALQFFSRTCSVFNEDDSTYAPDPGQFSVAQHVAHVAQTAYLRDCRRTLASDTERSTAAPASSCATAYVPRRRLLGRHRRRVLRPLVLRRADVVRGPGS